MDRDLLKARLNIEEGRRFRAYMDTTGNVTVGVGRNLTGKGLSEVEIEFLLDNDIDEVLADLSQFPWWATLDPIRQSVIADMRFNLGPDRFRNFRRMLNAVENRNYERAADSMKQSVWYVQVKDRAKRLVKMMLTGEIA